MSLTFRGITLTNTAYSSHTQHIERSVQTVWKYTPDQIPVNDLVIWVQPVYKEGFFWPYEETQTGNN